MARRSLEEFPGLVVLQSSNISPCLACTKEEAYMALARSVTVTRTSISPKGEHSGCSKSTLHFARLLISTHSSLGPLGFSYRSAVAPVLYDLHYIQINILFIEHGFSEDVFSYSPVGGCSPLIDQGPESPFDQQCHRDIPISLCTSQPPRLPRQTEGFPG